MSLSCACDFDYAEAGQWFWEGYSKQKPMKFFTRRKRCASCESFINTGDIVSEFDRYMQNDEESIAYRVDGEKSPLGSWYECEECNDMRLNLEELGYCVQLGDNTRELVREYAATQKEKDLS